MTENLFLQDQAVSFHRPYPASLTALHEKQPEQGIFYRQDGTPFLKLWMKNACDVKIVIGQDTYILLEVERNLWEVTLPLEPGFYYAALYVDSVEIASPYLPIGYGHSRPCNYLEIGPVMEACRLKDVLHGSIRHEYFYSEVTGQTESCLVYAPPGYDRDQLRLPVLYLQHGFGENEGSWVWQGRIGWMMDNFLFEKKVMPMLIVMADGMMSEDGDPEKKINPSLFTKFLTQDLMPYVEARYRVLTGRENCAVAGLSMGSMQAAMAAFSYPEKFAWIGLFSGFLRNYIGVEEIADSHLMQAFADVEAFNQNTRLLFRAMGREDSFFTWFMQEDQLCEDYGLKQVRRVYDGGHDWNVWRKCAAEFLPMLFRTQEIR